MNISEFLYQILQRLPLWVVFSLPFFLVIWGAYRFIMHSPAKDVSTRFKVVSLASITTILITPVPSGIFVALIPSGYLIFATGNLFKEIWLWLLVSGLITFLISALLFQLLIKKHNKEIQLTANASAD